MPDPLHHGDQPPARVNRRREGSEQRRARILEAARECFGRLGFGGATVEAIASEAGVSNGLLYQFFRNKEELFQVVVEDVIREWSRAIAAGNEGDSASERLERMFRSSLRFCANNPLLPAVLTRAHALDLERLDANRVDRLNAHRKLVAGVIRDGIASGEFRADLDVPALADLIGQLHIDYSTRTYRRDPQYPATPEVIDAAIGFIRRAVSIDRAAKSGEETTED